MKNFLRIELNPNRIYGLDILRAIAILFVVTSHSRLLVRKSEADFIELFLFDGVSIFFVLSGFLIGGILIKLLEEKEIGSKFILNFWIRRWFRTLPNYFLILLALLILNYIFTENFIIYDYKSYFVFSQNLFSNHPNFFPEAWSLSIEEWFYLILPCLLYIFIKLFTISINKSILLTAILIIMCVTLFRYFRYSSMTIDTISTWDLTLRKQVFTRLDSLMYGVIGAYLYFHYKTFWNTYKVHFLIVALVLFVLIKFSFLGVKNFGLYHSVFSFSVTSLATLGLIPFLSNLKQGKGFFYKLFTYISLTSYSMYLINLVIVQKWIIGKIDWSFLIKFNVDVFYIVRYTFNWFIIIIISIIIYKYFEIPIMNLRDRVRIK